jgi:penicillin-binding protein 2
MESSWVGTIIQNITLPLVKEQGTWRVDWTPGLIFSALDNANDPYYHRRLRLIPAEGHRGTIYDADGNPLAQDQAVYTVGVVPGQIKDEAALLQALSASLGMPSSQIKAMYTGKPAGNFVRIRTLPASAFTAVQNAINAQTQNGVAIQTGTGRVYPYGADTSAITGYVSVVTADDLKNDTEHIYGNGDMVGRAGIEQSDEQYLRPGRGGQLVIRDINADGSDGQIVVGITERTPTDGDDIHTSISIASQQTAMAKLRSFKKYAGSTVALDPTTGEVRVMASYPMYNPNDFSLDYSPGIAALSSLDHPYLNRAIAGAYPIGSVFKVITLSAALQSGISPTQVFSCPGYYQVPGEAKPRPDGDPHGHGNLTAPQALAPSCDVIFWTVAVMMNQQDPNILPRMAKAFGLGSATGMTGVAKGAENPGLVPDPAYLKEKKNAQWTPTDATNLAIGQGNLLVTPVQIAQISAAVGNNGVRMRPRLVTSITTPAGAVAESYPAEQVGTLPVSPANLSIVQTAMVSTTTSPSGTSYNEMHTFPVLVAAKTGTAESSGPQNPKPPHSCYTAYAPASPLSGPPVKPQIAVGAVVEYSSFGEYYALPVVESILKAYLKLSTAKG